MSVYGDLGNITALRKRCDWRGIELKIEPVDIGQPFHSASYDLVFVGGGQDKEQKLVAGDLQDHKGEAIRMAVEEDVVLLAVCGGYQLFARYYRPADGPDLPGIGIFDAVTIHKGRRVARCIGNIAIEWQGGTLVGFENHGGRTYLGPNCQPLGKVLVGFGNNGEDGGEGAVYRNAYGTYLHGSLLPKNPRFADHLLRLALQRKYGQADLVPLNDELETRAHGAAVYLAKSKGR
ncbi:MAG: glutamine amidotransferase [Chloroflexota bacterium]|nr:MAG: glutamine amidotransferase [Chloroflexota bacterium]